MKSESKATQSCLTLRVPMDCSPPGSSIHGIFQERVLEWGAIAFSSKLLPIYKTGIGAITVIQEPQHIDEICFWVPKRLLLPTQRSSLHNYETVSIHSSKSPNL